MAALLVVQNYLTTGFLAQVYIATLRPTDKLIGRRAGRRVARIDPSSGLSPVGPSPFSQTVMSVIM